MGMFKEGRFHGYGTVNYDGETRTGYLENDEKNMMWIPVTKQNITMYDPDKDPIAKEVLFEKYLYKDENQFAIPKLNQTINNPLIEKPDLVPRI